MVSGGRSSLLIPDGWKPAPGVRCSILPSRDDPAPPAGAWRCIDRAPSGWWLTPADDRARAWAQHWPNMLTQGCVQVAGSRLVSPGKVPQR